MTTRRPYRIASTRFYLLEALRAIGRVEDREGLNAAGLLAKANIVDALEKLESARKRVRPLRPRSKKTRIGGDDALLSLIRSSRAELSALALMRQSTGVALSRAAQRLISLERAGTITAAQSAMALEKIIAPLSHTEVKGMSSNQTDTPPELASYSDGVSDDGAFHPEIIGCGLDALDVGRSIQHLPVAGTGGIQHLSVAGGLGDLAMVGAYRGIPGYLLTQKGLSNQSVRLRVAQNIRAMTPKLRRRVLGRLRQAVRAARVMAHVSGQVRGAYPSIAGSPGVGWSGVMVSGRGGCPYANVAGALTP